IESKGLEKILIPLYGVYDDADEIDFEGLPNSFVLKTNNVSHTNIFCSDRKKIDIKSTKTILNQWLKERTTKAGREWAYYNIEPKIICEKLLKTNTDSDLIDYKFYCFEGKPYYIKVATNTNSPGGPENSIYNMKFEKLPYRRKETPPISVKIRKPRNFEFMCEVAEKLSGGFPHVRVDLYNVEGKVYFGELTFYDTSGYQIFEPNEFEDI